MGIFVGRSWASGTVEGLPKCRVALGNGTVERLFERCSLIAVRTAHIVHSENDNAYIVILWDLSTVPTLPTVNVVYKEILRDLCGLI